MATIPRADFDPTTHAYRVDGQVASRATGWRSASSLFPDMAAASTRALEQRVADLEAFVEVLWQDRLRRDTSYPARGDVVVFKGNTFFFQPNGTACYLYATATDVGHTERAVHTAARTAIRAPTWREQLAFTTRPMEDGFPRDDVTLVVEQVHGTERTDAVAALRRNNGDVIKAIMDLANKQLERGPLIQSVHSGSDDEEDERDDSSDIDAPVAPAPFE